MPANCGRSAARLAVPVLLVLLVSGCGGQTDESTAAGQATTSTTVAPTTTAVPRLTAQELAWLKAVTRLQQRMEKAFEKQSGMRLTRAKMTEYVNAMRSCSRELARMGSPSDRLEPVYVMVKKACRTFDKGAKCWATAASVSMGSGGVIAGTPEERTQRRAIDCAGAAEGNGINVLIQAEYKGELIEAKFG
jgi:hypothetical protein